MRERLLAMQDIPYRAFQRKLIPNIDPETIVGVRTPCLRMLAKEIKGTKAANEFLSVLPHSLFEENQLHAFLIEQEKSFDACMELVNRFLPYVDNWATCDQLSPKALTADRRRLLAQIQRWLASDETYAIRFGVNCLMRWYLDDEFDPAYPEMVGALCSKEKELRPYYVRMAVAWYFATALAAQWDTVILYLQNRRLDAWTHRKAIQKAVESNRITAEQKAYLKTLKTGRR